MPEGRPHSIAGVVLAAGLSQRFGRPKQLIEIQGRILLARVMEQVLRCEFCSVILVVGHKADDVLKTLDSDKGLRTGDMDRLTVVHNAKYASGQASSVRAGMDALESQVEAAMFIMGDQIGLTREHIKPILDRYERGDRPWVVRPKYGDRYGGPVLWARPSFEFLARLTNDQGGRAVIKDVPTDRVAYVDLPRSMEPVDIDTPQDLDKWLARAESS